MAEKWRCVTKCYHNGRLYQADEIVTVHDPEEELPMGRDPAKVVACEKAGGDPEKEIEIEIRHFKPLAKIEIPEGGDPEDADRIDDREILMAELDSLGVSYRKNASFNTLNAQLVRAKGEPGGA